MVASFPYHLNNNISHHYLLQAIVEQVPITKLWILSVKTISKLEGGAVLCVLRLIILQDNVFSGSYNNDSQACIFWIIGCGGVIRISQKKDTKNTLYGIGWHGSHNGGDDNCMFVVSDGDDGSIRVVLVSYTIGNDNFVAQQLNYFHLVYKKHFQMTSMSSLLLFSDASSNRVSSICISSSVSGSSGS